jgi:hypothetical protein
VNEKLNDVPITSDAQNEDEFEDPDELNELLSESTDPPAKTPDSDQPINPAATEDKSY